MFVKSPYLALSLSFLIMIGCTSQNSAQNASNDQDGITSQSQRGPASVNKARKSIKIARKGFLIKHSSLKPLAFRERVSYYRIFLNAQKDMEKLLGKRRRGNALLDFDSILKSLSIQSLEAAACPSAFWLLDNGQTTCTRDNSFYRPETSPQWATYGPVGDLANGITTCRSAGNAMACPPLGLSIVGTSAQLICTSDSRGLTTSCEEQFNNGGIANTVRLMDECESSGQLTSVTNITCDDLRTSVERAVSMFQDNCTSANRSGNSLVSGACGRIQTAVNSVERRIREELDPASAVDLPDIPSCNRLASGVERGNDETARESSPHWNSLLDIARRNCPNLSGRDRAHVRNIFGSCSARLNIPSGVSLQGLADDFAAAARANEAGNPNNVYNTRFINSFGMPPSRFLSLFCGANEASTFINRVNDDIGELTRLSEEQLVNHLRFQDRPGNDLTEPQFNALQAWRRANDQALTNLISGGMTLEGVNSTLRDGEVTEAVANIRRVLSTPGVNLSGPISLEQYFQERVLEGKTRDQERQIRATYARALRQVLVSQQNRDRIQASSEWLNQCSQEILTASGETTVVAGNRFQTEGELNTRGCRYVQETDLSGYLDRTEDANIPFIVYRRPLRGREAACLRQNGPIRETEHVSGGNRVIVRSMDAVNPMNPNDGEQNVVLNSAEFDTGGANQGSRPFVLYRYTCPRDVAADTSNPFLDTDSTF